MAKRINLRDFYYWYTQDEFVEVSDEVAAELFADKRQKETYERTMRRNAVRSLDAMTENEVAIIVHSTDSPAAVLVMKERHYRLCCALNSLPEIQGRRVEAHFLFGKSIKEISDGECTGERNVRK